MAREHSLQGFVPIPFITACSPSALPRLAASRCTTGVPTASSIRLAKGTYRLCAASRVIHACDGGSQARLRVRLSSASAGASAQSRSASLETAHATGLAAWPKSTRLVSVTAGWCNTLPVILRPPIALNDEDGMKADRFTGMARSASEARKGWERRADRREVNVCWLSGFRRAGLQFERSFRTAFARWQQCGHKTVRWGRGILP